MHIVYSFLFIFFFFFNDTATTEIYTLSLHDALPIFAALNVALCGWELCDFLWAIDRKSTRLNSSHRTISYAVFCLKKKKNTTTKYSCTNDKLDPQLSLLHMSLP